MTFMVQAVTEQLSGVPAVAGVRLEFILFAVTLLGVAILHKHAMYVALGGLASILLFKLVFDPAFAPVEHLLGSPEREGEWRTLLNLLGLLLGFAVLARHFEDRSARRTEAAVLYTMAPPSGEGR